MMFNYMPGLHDGGSANGGRFEHVREAGGCMSKSCREHGILHIRMRTHA